MHRTLVFLILFFVITFGKLFSQTARLEGLRENIPSVFAFTNADIVTAPGKLSRGATMVIRDGVIEDIGRRASIPADAWVYDLEGKMIYPGFIDLYTHYGLSDSIAAEENSRLNPQVRSHYRAAENFSPDDKQAAILRSQGFVMVQSVPEHGLLKGYSSVVSLGDTHAEQQIIKTDATQAVSFRRSERRPRGYPASLMGAIALIRQTLLDAEWYESAQEAHRNNPATVRPENNMALQALAESRQENKAFIFTTTDENCVFRASAMGNEFGLQAWIMGSGKEYRRTEAVRQTGLPFIIPIDFPKAPDVDKPEKALSVSLEDLRHWYFAPENPGRLVAAGVPVCLSAYGSDSKFIENLRTSVERGLSKDDALAALTTRPARMLGLNNRYGSLEKGKAASFFIADGDIFEHESKITEVWVDGRQYPLETEKQDLAGEWEITGFDELDDAELHIAGQPNRLRGHIEKNDQKARLQQLKFTDNRLSFRFDGDSLGIEGLHRLSATISNNEMLGIAENAEAKFFTWTARRTGITKQEEKKQPVVKPPLDLPERFPSMEYGLQEIPAQPRHVLIKNATIWTQGDEGILENADMLITRGVITRTGQGLEAPIGALIIEADGMHVTPGLIDPHLHTSITGNVNETGSAITSETRIEDVIHGDNVWIYRLLAGGITSATLFHGSANPIGGQSAIIKMRVGHLPNDLLIKDAAPGLKFALGENVKGMDTRYPNTRQGTEQIIRDALQAALEYEKASKPENRAVNALPLRRDLQLEAILEVINGKRKAHVHAYRQDEMLMMIRLAEAYGFTIGSFEHTLEGYKIADELKDHGAAAVVWTDWSSFKVEAQDGILHNARLLNDVGVLTSLHSDNTQLSTRMNWEAAKTMKTGVSEIDAMNFITMHPAKIMGIDHRTGSLEAGKDADFVIWNGHPLSSFSIPQQSWVDGRKYFDREKDAQLREEVRKERAMIIDHILHKNDD